MNSALAHQNGFPQTQTVDRSSRHPAFRRGVCATPLATIGGYGLRTERTAFDWMEERFDMRIVKLRETDGFLYHLDTTILPLAPVKTVVCTEVYSRREIKAVEAVTDIVPVTRREALPGVCNSLVLGRTLITASHIEELDADSEAYELEALKIRRIETIAAAEGLDVKLFNLSEFLKGGALLSCMIMHLAKPVTVKRLRRSAEMPNALEQRPRPPDRSPAPARAPVLDS